MSSPIAISAMPSTATAITHDSNILCNGMNTWLITDLIRQVPVSGYREKIIAYTLYSLHKFVTIFTNWNSSSQNDYGNCDKLSYSIT